MLKILNYTYRLYLTEEQEAKLIGSAGAGRWVWNYFLAKNIELYNKEKKFYSYPEMCKMLTALKQEKEWLYNTDSQALQQKLRDLSQALKNKVKRTHGFPKFKKKSNYSDSLRYTQGVKFDKGSKNKVYIPKLGICEQIMHRDLPSDYTNTTIKQDGVYWTITYTVEVEMKSPKDILELIFNAVGIDLGLNDFFVSSDGEVVENPRFGTKEDFKIKLLQQKLSGQVKGSNNYKKTQEKLRKEHQKVRNQRKDFLHKMSRMITNFYSLVCTEDLDIQKMMQNHKFAKSIGRAGWSMFLAFIQYKQELNGGDTIKIGQYDPSTQTCCVCLKRHNLKIGDRQMICDCGNNLSRDANAAINILLWGLKKFIANRGNLGGSLNQMRNQNIGV